MKIYTRTGDSGKTSLIGGQRVPKGHPRLEAYGALDELNSLLGVLRLYVSPQTGANEILLRIQRDIFAVGTVLATPENDSSDGKKLAMPTEEMESDIDRLWAMAPELHSFVLPQGCQAALHAHHARTVCRRAERSASLLCDASVGTEWVIAYLNRLSDWLFALSRAENAVAGIDEDVLLQ
ncbi:MAG: cob(I)yrinic acid a,c-diamide adenosyltransferase [Holophagaceae bacterium]|nr:cob(I)yrinic acid a,c-diamide adenosyltransferase [Holophagaceae bacterium]